MNEWDGTPWAGTIVTPEPPRPRNGSALISKAESGLGVAMITHGTPYLMSTERNPQRLMRAAQAAYHANPWIRLAESVVTRRVVGLPWHLEDDQDEEWADPAPGPVQVARGLLETPLARLPENAPRRPAVATYRGLVSITSRHVGLCGMAYWYLDQREAMAGTPLALLYVNPARVWPAEDEGGNLLGWVLDPKSADGRGGIPLSMSELLPFYLDPPDTGNIGSGLYEAAVLKAQITTLADQHAAYVLGTGGRIAGVVSPKEGTLNPDQYEALVKEFRTVNDAPDAAKRTTILRGPIDFTQTAADPKDLNLAELSKMNRDDILALWGVPPSQAAIPTASGLNSGETRKYDEAVLMQGSVHDRVRAIRETVQYGLLDRWQALGYTVEWEIEEPEFDDRTPLYEIAAKARDLPLRNSERRELVGLEPFGDTRDDEVWLPATIVVAYGADGLAPEPPPVVAPVVPPQLPPGEMPETEGKADREFLGLRRSVETRWVPSLRRSLASVLASQRHEVAERIRGASAEVVKRHRRDGERWLPAAEDERLAKVLRGHAAGVAETVARRTTEVLAAKADPVDSATAVALRRAAKRIKGINDTTREAIVTAVSDGIADGLSPAEIAAVIDDLPAFDAARAEMVARTETMLAYNDAALASYREYGVTHVQAIDGDTDEECAARNGRTFTLEESFDITDHPNGTLDWIPVV